MYLQVLCCYLPLPRQVSNSIKARLTHVLVSFPDMAALFLPRIGVSQCILLCAELLPRCSFCVCGGFLLTYVFLLMNSSAICTALQHIRSLLFFVQKRNIEGLTAFLCDCSIPSISAYHICSGHIGQSGQSFIFSKIFQFPSLCCPLLPSRLYFLQPLPMSSLAHI